jgi:predicted Ser/Thr protein kinase
MLKAGLAVQTEGPGAAGEAAGPRFIPPPVGEIARLFPQLEILRLIGQGGMGAVYKARQPALDRFVALKVLPPTAASDPGFAERFNREARALARLNHPNIVAVHDFGKAGTLHYLVMEFVDGANLREIERLGELTPEQALAIVPQICEALQFAHNEGIIHRDIKPENLLLDKKGRVKITDFGIAKMVRVGANQQNLTGAKDVVGTPHYMAPEQIEHPLTVDHRADIYSLGVVFYEMLTGELPLGKFAPPSKKVQIDVRLDEVVLHALEKEPDRRYQQASQVKTAVETIVTTPPGGGSVDLKGPAPTAIQIEAIRNQLKIPGRGLMAAGILQLLFALGLLVFAMPAIAREGGGLPGYAAVGFGAVVCTLFAAIVLLGAARMMKLRNYPFCVVAGIVAALAGPGAILGLPFGVWAIVVLNRREVSAAFEANRHDRNSRPKRFGFAWKFVAFIFVLILSYVLSRTVFSHLITGQVHPARSDYIGQTWFPLGDSIEITSVERTKNEMTVKGNYNLVSHDRALLALYITSTHRSTTPIDAKQQMRVAKGRGDFELTHSRLVPGLPHVSMYGADGHPFATVYFGTKNEALEASKASWITNSSSVSALQFRLVLPNDSTAPADWLPSASSSNRCRLSRQVLLDDAAIARAGVDFDSFGKRMIKIRFTDAGAQEFEAITATNIGHQLAIVFRGRVLSAPVIQSVIPSGECQVSGSMSAEETHEIVDCLNRSAKPTAEACRFSQVQERILPFKTLPDVVFGWLDLDTGTVWTNSTLDWQTRAGHDWIQIHGLDVVTSPSAIQLPKHFPTLLGIDMTIAPTPTNGWDVVTAADVMQNWAFLQDEPRQMQFFGAPPGQSDTFFFQTREGGKGILQILGFADNPPGVKVRYRLVQATTSKSQPSSPAFEPADLRGARAELAELRVSFSESSPQIQAAMARVKELERLTKEEPNAPADLREAKAHLAELRMYYSARSPQIQEALARIKALEQSTAAPVRTNLYPVK